MTVIFLQVRLDSSRLPGKALLPILGKPIVTYAMEALGKIPAEARVLVTEEGSRRALEPLASQAGFALFCGSKFDVLRRFVDALEEFPADTVVRATGDNPLVSWEMAGRLLREHREREADYSGYFGLPLGCGVEVLKAECLVKADGETADRYDREHVTPYLYRNPDLFLLHRPLAEPGLRSRFSVTVDTREDYERVSEVMRRVYREGPPSIAEVTACIRSLEVPGESA